MSDRRFIKMLRCKNCKQPVYQTPQGLVHAPSYRCTKPELVRRGDKTCPHCGETGFVQVASHHNNVHGRSRGDFDPDCPECQAVADAQRYFHENRNKYWR